MNKLEPLKTLGYSLNIDFEQESFSAVIEKLANSGLTTFRLNLEPVAVVCMAFDPEACKELEDAMDGYLNRLENRQES